MSQKTKLDEKSKEQLISLLKEKDEIIRILQTENDILTNIIAMIPGNVYWKDRAGRFLGCNNNVAQILGFISPKEIVGKYNKDLFASDIAHPLNDLDEEILITAKEKYIEETGVNIALQPAIYLSKKLPLFNPAGEVIGILGVSFDITERKKMEQDLKIAKEKAEASNRAKSQFLAVINHELRTPLASIIGLVDFLKQDNMAQEERQNVIGAIENCTEHLLNLVNEVLEFSRLETGKHTLHLTTINLSEIISEVCNITKTLATRKNIALRVISGENVPKYLISDARVLKHIMINLVSNAIKFTDHGHVTIALHVREQSTEMCELEISVKDTGLGIPADKIDVIFEPFQQLEDAYTRQSSRAGTGLGLTIVERLAKLIHARIHVQSKPGLGSQFSLICRFTLPEHTEIIQPQVLVLEEPLKNEKAKALSRRKSKAITSHGATPRVLLVEDDPIVQFVHHKMLNDLGCHVDIAAHGNAALTLFNHHDIVFVDISLPDISGFSVIEKIRENKDTAQTPIVALTVYTGKEEKQACLAAGANEFISKPVSMAHFRKVLKRHLKSDGQ